MVAPAAAAAPAVPAGVFDPAAVAEAEQLWWTNSRADVFYHRAENGTWLEWSRGALASYLRGLGLSGRSGDDGPSEVERVLVYLRTKRVIFGALDALAGYHAGIHDLSAGRFLIRTSPHVIQPETSAKGWPTIAALLNGLLGGTAVGFFLAWLKLSYEGLLYGTRDRGQVLIIAGPIGCGKSRIQHQIITPVLGGRHADPTAFIYGDDKFNGDLAVAEHLLCEDPAVILKPHVREHLKERLKKFSVGDSARVAAKYQNAATLTPYWRVSMTINDDPDTLNLIPQMTPDWRDKVLLMQARPGGIPMPTCTPAEKAAFRAAIDEELPAMLAELVSDDFWAAYPHTRGGRFGSLHYADPELALRLSEGTPAELLLALVDDALFTAQGGMIRDHGSAWEGSADDLQTTLTADLSPVAAAANRLFNRAACNRMLPRLQADHPTRVSRDRTQNKRWWRIEPPPAVDSAANVDLSTDPFSQP